MLKKSRYSHRMEAALLEQRISDDPAFGIDGSVPYGGNGKVAAQTGVGIFATRHVVRPTRWASKTPTMPIDQDAVWSGFIKAVLPR